ncbi:type II toxin-antitoxin system Phd/YefM family antitoxin [Salinibacter ruber]|uniref:type II toxin-antitoxin system Phd/YefM family antitoxin n=4 Tax=Salinibacter ruber TaxID=146919 RepID=UPI003C6E5D6C
MPETRVPVEELQSRLGDWLRRVEEGEPIVITRKGRDVAQIKAVKEVAREDSLPSLEESRASVTVSGEDLSETVRQQRWEHRDRVLSECAGSIATECFQSALGASRPSAFRVRWERSETLQPEYSRDGAALPLRNLSPISVVNMPSPLSRKIALSPCPPFLPTSVRTC